MSPEIRKNRESAEGTKSSTLQLYRYAFVEYEKEDQALKAMQ